jgi:extracellular elastinolytic metalloproteinase
MRRVCIAVSATAVVALGAAAGAQGAPRIQGEHARLADRDVRTGRVAPSSRQRALARREGLRVTWNRFGTPRSLAATRGSVASGLSADPVVAARQWIAGNRALLGIGAGRLEVVRSAPIGSGHAVMLRQRYGSLAAARDGLIVVGVVGGRVKHVSSSLAQDTAFTNTLELGAGAAVRAAAAEAGLSASDRYGKPKLIAIPTPERGVRRAWMVQLYRPGGDPQGVASYVDAETGVVLVRDSLVDHASDNPTWKAFPSSPPLDYSNTDTRVQWCWTALTGCALAVGNSASLDPWDVDSRTNESTFTTRGNNSIAVDNWLSNNTRTVGTDPATPRLNRDYEYAWTNQWHQERCNPTTFDSPQHNDIDAARANLFAMHNRVHDFAYNLGFTEANWNAQDFNDARGGLENDSEQGNAQAGGVVGGPPNFPSRDNANQFTPADGMKPITNMYLWQPIAAAFYSPCVDGDYDMSVIAHEYTHAISNRMAGGPNAGLSGNQAQAMGESWSDLDAVEYLNENGYVPIGDENPFAVGPYVTGDHQAGIRNYGMNHSPLNYSDVGYDFVCNDTRCEQQTQVHADGEIWSATNYDIRQAFIARYGAGNAALQVSCARGDTPVTACPGNRRWIQLMYDAWLLMPTGAVSMLDARNAMLAADQIRFNGVNQDILWNGFAHRGLGQGAASNGTQDFDPVPSFDSPYADEATVRFKPTGDASGRPAQLFVGQYEARVTPIADTEPSTPLGDTFKLVPGTYEFLARGNGFGAVRTTLTVKAGQLRDLPVNMRENLASKANGASATGDGTDRDALIDDTESTNWASLGSPIAGKQVTVRLDPSSRAVTFRRIQVSAQLRTARPYPAPAPLPNPDPSQNRFTALRQFELLSCEVTATVDCSQDSQFTSVFTSAPDAFPSSIPRPRAPELTLRSFDVPQTRASYVRLRVLSNQCTGQALYHGDLDDDPGNDADCTTGSTQDDNVRAAELQVFAR